MSPKMLCVTRNTNTALHVTTGFGREKYEETVRYNLPRVLL
jgi:hypothetical protein